MNLLDISRSQLLSELYDSQKVMYRILNLQSESQILISMSISPYLSLLCEGIDRLFSDDDLKRSEKLGEIEGISFTELMTKNRASMKLLTDKKINEALKKIDKQIIDFNNVLTKDYEGLEREYISRCGQPDLGVYFFKGIPFLNTSQVLIYQDMFIKMTDNNIDGVKLGQINRDFTFTQVKYISLLVSENEGDILPTNKEECKVNISDKDFSDKDFIFFNEVKRDVFTKHSDKGIILYLFNLRCQLSFALMIVPQIIDRNSSLRYRIEMIVYYQTVNTIKFLINKNRFPMDNDQKKIIENIIVEFDSIFLNNSLRNNIFHYEFSEDNVGMKLTNNYFFSMIEFQTKQSFEDIFNTIEKSMLKLVEVLDEITALT